MVVFHHTINASDYYLNLNIPLLTAIGSFGKYGVDFFFLLSGFIISYSSSINEKRTFGKYFINRILRIYVPYLPIGIAMYVLYALLPGFSNAERDLSLIRSVTLVPIGSPALSVAWTLSYEMMFYILFGLSFISRRLWNWFVVLWALLIIVVNYIVITDYTTIFLNPYNLEFILGYFVSYLYIKRFFIGKRVGIALAVLFFMLLCLDRYFGMLDIRFGTNLLFAASMFFLIWLSIVYYNIRFGNRFLLMMLGNASYSIYLVHNPLMSFVMRFLPVKDSVFVGIIEVIFVVTVCSVFGYLYYLVFEKMLLQKVKTLSFLQKRVI